MSARACDVCAADSGSAVGAKQPPYHDQKRGEAQEQANVERPELLADPADYVVPI